MRIASPVRRISFALLLLGMTACTSAPNLFVFPGVHRIAIAQGNYVDEEQLEELRLGMTRTQVQFVLGTPLVMDSFDLDRWDYTYLYYFPTGEVTERSVTLFFEDNSLVRAEGDYSLPGEEAASPEA